MRDKALRSLDTNVFPRDQTAAWRHMVRRDIEARFGAAVREERLCWEQAGSVAEWERFRDERLARMRHTLGSPWQRPRGEGVDIHVTGTLQGSGYVLRKIVYETQPGILVTALLYLPDPPPESTPGIQVCHAHHQPKDQAELQDMGVNWARTGCAVLVPDMLGHGERGQDAFGARQGYYSRYYEAMQLGLVGESLAGWMVWDLVRGIDVLLAQPGIDSKRIIMIGAVAGGGDPAAMAAALDPRITCCIPFNFGQGSAWREGPAARCPEGRNLAGWPYWEPTRGLCCSARDQFFPWLILAAAAPRFLIKAHEFAWDAENDESWARLRAVYALYDAGQRLGWQKGSGRCAPGEGNTHCTNVGPVHRGGLYPYLQKWFGMPVPEETRERHEEDDLRCLSAELETKRETVMSLCSRKARTLVDSLRRELKPLAPRTRRVEHARRWREILGPIETASDPRPEVASRDAAGNVLVEKIRLGMSPRLVVPVVWLRPRASEKVACVLGVAQQGKQAFLAERSEEIAELLDAGLGVCLADVRGTGETSLDDSHGLNSRFITEAECERMLGGSMLAEQLRDLRAVMAYLRTRDDVARGEIALWGDSFASLNPPGFEPGEHDRRKVDHDHWPNAPYGPSWAEPLGQMLVLLGALFDDDVRAVLVRRGLVSFLSLYDFAFFRVPSDVMVQDALRAGDIADLAASAECPVRFEGSVDACNRAVDQGAVNACFRDVDADNVSVLPDLTRSAVDWIVRTVR